MKTVLMNVPWELSTRTSSRRLAAREFREIRVVSCSHAAHITAQIVVPLSHRAGSRLEVWAQQPAHESEHARVHAGRLAAHEKRLVTEDISDRIDRPRRQ